jgi:hypothetical protein
MVVRLQLKEAIQYLALSLQLVVDLAVLVGLLQTEAQVVLAVVELPIIQALLELVVLHLLLVKVMLEELEMAQVLLAVVEEGLVR